MTLIDLKTKVKVISVPIDFSYDFLWAVNSNVCSRTHRLATIHNVTEDDRRQKTHAKLSISASA